MPRAAEKKIRRSSERFARSLSACVYVCAFKPTASACLYTNEVKCFGGLVGSLFEKKRNEKKILFFFSHAGSFVFLNIFHQESVLFSFVSSHTNDSFLRTRVVFFCGASRARERETTSHEQAIIFQTKKNCGTKELKRVSSLTRVFFSFATVVERTSIDRACLRVRRAERAKRRSRSATLARAKFKPTVFFSFFFQTITF